MAISAIQPNVRGALAPQRVVPNTPLPLSFKGQDRVCFGHTPKKVDAYTAQDEKRSFLDKLFLKAIAWYQNTFRTEKNGQLGNKLFTCSFQCSCSTYTADAIREFGAIKGSLIGLKRVLKCNPLYVALYRKLHGVEGLIDDPVPVNPAKTVVA